MQKVIESLKKYNHSFLLFLILSEIFYLSFYLVAPLKKFLGDTSLGIESRPIIIFVISILLILSFLYFFFLERIDFSKLGLRSIFLTVTVFNLSLVLIKPITSDDFYTYVQRGRIVSQYRGNPYITPYAEFDGDSLKKDITTAWSGNTEIYGPFMVYINAFLTLLGGNSLFWNLFFFKLFFISANVACAFLVWKITHDKKSLFVYSLNPLITFVFSVDLHNDVIMILLFLIGFLLITKNGFYKKLTAFSFFLLSALTKEFTWIAIPFIFVFLTKNEKGMKKRALMFISLLILTVVLSFILYLPFWKGLVIFKRLKELTSYEVTAASLGVLLVSGITGFFSKNSANIANILNKLVFSALYFEFLLKSFFKNEFLHLEKMSLYLLLIICFFFLTFFTRYLPWYSSFAICAFAVYWGLSKKYDKKLLLYTFMFYSLLIYAMIL